MPTIMNAKAIALIKKVVEATSEAHAELLRLDGELSADEIQELESEIDQLEDLKSTVQDLVPEEQDEEDD